MKRTLFLASVLLAFAGCKQNNTAPRSTSAPARTPAVAPSANAAPAANIANAAPAANTANAAPAGGNTVAPAAGDTAAPAAGDAAFVQAAAPTAAPAPTGRVFEADGIRVVVRDDHQVEVHTTDNWDNAFDQTYENCAFLSHAVPTLRRAFSPEKVAVLVRACGQPAPGSRPPALAGAPAGAAAAAARPVAARPAAAGRPAAAARPAAPRAPAGH